MRHGERFDPVTSQNEHCVLGHAEALACPHLDGQECKLDNLTFSNNILSASTL